MKMIADTINDEILRIKRQLSSVHENDIARIVADARSRQTNVVSHQTRQDQSEQGGQADTNKAGELPCRV